MISSPEINKILRQKFSPILRENGFSIVQPRKAWGWHDHCIWVLNIRAVGSYFSAVTGWPPMSVTVSVGVYYDFIPEESSSVEVDSRGQLRPDEAVCQMRSQLATSLDQGHYKSRLSRPAERERNDIWWIAPSGENTADVIEDITLSFETHGISWFKFYTVLENAFAEIESGHDCYSKFYQAAYFAQYLGYERKSQEYLERLKHEKERIGVLLGRRQSKHDHTDMITVRRVHIL